MQFLKVDETRKAVEKVLKLLTRLAKPPQQVGLAQAANRILAFDIVSKYDIPAFDRSTVDGFALRAAETSGAGEAIPAFFYNAGEVEMGRQAQMTLVEGQCAYIPTGGMLPKGADAVVMTEYCEKFSDDLTAVHRPVFSGENVLRTGSDASKGAVLLPAGRKLRAQDIGALAAAGIDRVPVVSPLHTAIISTGDEIVAPGSKLRPGEVYDINSSSLAAAVTHAGLLPPEPLLLPDNPQLLLDAVEKAKVQNDIVIVSGGSSRGPKDETMSVLDSSSGGGIFTRGLAMKPGKPTILAFDEESRTLLAGLPGHPVAALLVFERIIARAWRALNNMPEPPAIPAIMTSNAASDPGRETCLPVRLKQTGDYCYSAEPILGESAMITTLSGSDGFVVIARNSEGLKSGRLVWVYRMGGE
jgi:molybdopterin molybdotransferase